MSAADKRTPIALATLLLTALPGAFALADQDAALKVGSPAPQLHISQWVQGGPVAEFEKDKIYVVEFWATWCGPCRAVIPHMSELNTKYDGKVTFIGVDIWEDAPDKVKKFVADMGEKMNYNVAIDEGGREGKTAAAWMKAANQRGIPTAFIVGPDGKIAWIGHPGGIDEPLAKVVAGDFDPAAEAELAARREKVMKKFMAAQRNGNFEKMLELIDEMAEVDPAFATEAGAFRFGMLLQLDRYDEAYKLAAALAEGDYRDNASGLNHIAWTILDEEGIETRDYDLAMKIAKRAVEVSEGKDAAILDTLARAYFDTGEVAKAITLQRKAVKLADDDIREELEQTLERYEKATQVN